MARDRPSEIPPSPELPVTYDVYAPPLPLGAFVELIWYWRGYPTTGARERLMPMASTELVVDLTSKDPADSGVSGPRSKAFFIERTAQDELLGVHFAPGGVFPFIPFPSDELHNQGISLVDFCGDDDAGRLVEALHRTPGIRARIHVVEGWLESIRRRQLEHHPGVAFAMREFSRDPGLASTAAVARSGGLTPRHLSRIFLTEVGVTPKRYCRLLRFNRILQQVARQRDVDWADLALEWGYFDQAHFNHDFRAFSGLTPSEYLDLRIPDHVGHVHAPD